ncbi:MAG TPA: hypothetical protein VE783_01660 [Candidatus Limnocylindrales bacterium]|nr:hypothetical protein [Candidatus Limnocylindrales bacterium]
MKTCSSILGSICITLAFASGPQVSRAQAAQHPLPKKQVPTPTVATIDPGTQLVAEFDGPLNVTKLKPGSEVKAVLTQDLISRGVLVAAAESKLIGHVAEVSPRQAQTGDSRLLVIFDKLKSKKTKAEIPLTAIVLALAPPAPRSSMVDKPDQMMPPMTLSPGQSVNNRTNGRGSTPTSSSGATLNSSTLVLLQSMNQTPVVQSTPGSDASAGMARHNPAEQQKKAAAISSGAGVRGVYGMKKVALQGGTAAVPTPTVIIGLDSNLKLDRATQVILLVTNPLVAKQ